jgi:hypothetical protein
MFGASFAHAASPNLCDHGGQWTSTAARAPAAVTAYLDSLGEDRFDLRAACAQWAGTFSKRHRVAAGNPQSAQKVPPRLIMYPADGTTQRDLIRSLKKTGYVYQVETTRKFVIVSFSKYMPTSRLMTVLNSPEIGYVEPDCDGPDYLTTSTDHLPAVAPGSQCWQRAARATFPNDPCLDELWGHQKIGWDPRVAARSLPRMVAVLDSGIDANHQDLARNVVLHLKARETPRNQRGRLNARCATSGRCYPHGTEMAGTIGGRMDNGIGVVGVAPNSRLLPIVISRSDRGLLARISTIAAGIDDAVRDGAQVINISAKWPVDSRAISESIVAAVGGPAALRRLVVTGYATSLDRDDRVLEYFPSLYRCLPGVIAAVPTDMRGHELFNPKGRQDATDGRIQAPGVDIVVTTTENSDRGYALSGSAGASSAAAYVSGAVALVWGSPPLNKCDAQQIKQLLFCRSKSGNSTRYPWVNVEFLRELANVDPGANCRSAMEALGCN